jgi:hypothetical protein
MALHFPPKLYRGGVVIRYAALSAKTGHRCVVVTAQHTDGKYNVFTLTAEYADSPWVHENGLLDLSEFAAISKFREYEQKG